MAAWDDALKALGDEGKQLAAQLKDVAKQISDDMSSFMLTEVDRVKGYLTQRNNGDIDDDVLATLLRGEKRYVQQHLDFLDAQKEAATETAVTDALLSILVKLIKLLI